MVAMKQLIDCTRIIWLRVVELRAVRAVLSSTDLVQQTVCQSLALRLAHHTQYLTHAHIHTAAPPHPTAQHSSSHQPHLSQQLKQHILSAARLCVCVSDLHELIV